MSQMMMMMKTAKLITPSISLTQITVTSEPDNEKEDDDEQTEKEDAPAKPVYSDSESSDEEDERELQGRTYSEKGVEVRGIDVTLIVRNKNLCTKKNIQYFKQ